MYSQNNEEQFIIKKFENNLTGTFLDIGAFDGRWASNSLSLAERGWSGICVEGSPFSFSKLFVEHKDRNNVLLLNAIVVPDTKIQERITKFWESPNSAASTINQDNYDKWKDRIQSCGHGSFKEMFVPKISFEEVLNWAKSFHSTIDFVSIDVEGGSTDLALQYDPDLFGTTMMCIEHDGRQNELIVHFAKKKFKVINMNAENIIFAK